MFLPGEIVEVQDYNQATRKMDWRIGYKVRVVHSRYEASSWNPAAEFVGVVLTGRFEGSTLSIQNNHARRVGE